jgi:hypothetical protein
MDTLHLSTSWFETDKGWRSFSDPSVVRVPIAESGVTLSERRVQRGVTLAVVLVGIPVAAYILLWILYATTYDAAT